MANSKEKLSEDDVSELGMDSDSASASDSDSDSDQDPRFKNVTGRTGMRRKQFKARHFLLDFVKTLDVSIDTIKRVTDNIIEVVKTKYVEDILLMSSNKSISLLGKWLPTERGNFAKHNFTVWKRLVYILSKAVASELGTIAFNENQVERDYRVRTVGMRDYIDVAERHMCEGTWSELDPSKVPSKCAAKNRKAFLNELTEYQAKHLGRETELIGSESITGNRYPDREDRVNTRLKWLDAIASKKIKGSQLSPDELVMAAIKATTTSEKDMINAQWISLRDSVQIKIEKARQEGFKPMDNIIPMIDLSPSMNSGHRGCCSQKSSKTSPKMAAIGLGIMLSELNAGPCRDLLVTFDSRCEIIDLRKCKNDTFTEKVSRVLDLPEGYSTNFHLAIERICGLVRVNKLPQESIPALCILSDEQFDNPQFGYNATMEDRMNRMFHDVGMEISGTPYSKPRTVHWNLRGDTEGFPAIADSENVQMIAGYSPSLFDLILCGKPSPTPFETMRRKLDSARYQPVRDAFNSVSFV